MPNEKSSSELSSNRFFCASVSTLYASCLVSDGVRSVRGSRCRCPCTRTCGGVFVVMWRSEPPISTSVFKSSGNVAISLLNEPQRPQSSQRSRGNFFVFFVCFVVPIRCTFRGSYSSLLRGSLFHRLPHHLFDRRDAVLHLPQSAVAQRDHPVVDGFSPQLQARGADENQLAQILADLHHFVQTDAAFVAGQIAAIAADAFEWHDGVRIGRRKSGLDERRRRERRRLLAVRADAADQTLGTNQVHRAGYEKRLDAHVHQPVDRARRVVR